jgi:hypothetical protein
MIVPTVSLRPVSDIPLVLFWKMVDYLKKALIYGHTSRISS